MGENIDPAEIIDVAAGALKEVGDLFEGGELFLPEVMRAANAAKASLNIVLPLAANTGTRGRGSSAKTPSICARVSTCKRRLTA